MNLSEYKRKRDFQKTREPQGLVRQRDSQSLIFAIQKHAASRLHYDFRLELNGVLKSWAIPKGPSLNPKDKRLAVHVEDHPFDYKDFEGTIPKGEYGGGTVLLWDKGVWIPHQDPEKDYREGKLEFELKGKKLKGNWVLLKMHGEAGANGKNWLLLKEKDKAASDQVDLLQKFPKSVVSGRTLEEITASTHPKIPTSLVPPSQARKAPLPHFLKPQLATLTSKTPTDDHWLHETKFDGYRALSRIEKGKVKIFTRKGNDWTSRFPNIAKALAKLPVEQAFLDGEIVKLLPNGLSSFQALQNALGKKEEKDLYYYIFDILHWNGLAFIDSPLEDRRNFLEKLLRASKENDLLGFSEAILGKGKIVFQEACRQGLEGIISKRRDRGYEPGRSRNWLKIKCTRRQEFVIIGFTEPSGSRRGFGALLLGVYDSKGTLHYTGHVGTGFSHDSLKQLYTHLQKLEQPKPVLKLPEGVRRRKIHWVKPELVAEVEFSEWTQDNILRQPSFQGLREDKVAIDVVREETKPPPAPSDLKERKRVRSKSDQIAGVQLTHPDEILFSEQGITKQDLASFYLEIAEYILPYLKDRPLSLVRCPEGAQKKCFFQKHLNQKTSANALKTITIKEKGEAGIYIMANDISGLITLVQMRVLEIHPWGSRADDIEHPDLMTFDIDPDPSVEWKRVIQAAQLLHSVFDQLHLKSFVKTTGGKGLHVVIPLSRKHDWDEVKDFSKMIAQTIAKEDPTHYTYELSKAKRKGKIFLDYLRNQRGATAIAPYSTRARSEAPVAVPLSWEELDVKLKSDHFNVKNLKKRLSSLKKDPWKEFFSVKQSLPVKIE
jgi:bifunctional non-homologous end joining protein LigD